MKHTPTPWSIGEPSGETIFGPTQTVAGDEVQIIIATTRDYYQPRTSEADCNDIAKANAAFIIQAVNTYDRLVSENERLRKALEDLYGLTHWILDQGAPDMEIPIEKSGFNGSTDIMGRAREALGGEK